ncbi:MAG: hypothetical protein JJE39_05215 [Vicinamibacteria bacterium]|nr:hypothetical protein [Vicinamibacteria bacterium]
MKNRHRSLGLLGVLLLLTTRGAADQDGGETPTYSNVRVVSIDPARRIVVLLTAKGRKETLVFDDLLQSTGGIKAGDLVIVTVRGGPGRQRMSAISLARTPPAVSPAKESKAVRLIVGAARTEMDRFAEVVAVISGDARSVDASWASFVTACDVRQPETTSGGREWFGLWDGRVQADYSGGFCRDLFNQIVSAGEGIKKAMAAAESVVQHTLEPGEIRDIRTLHNMNWDGWTLPPPARRDP